MAVINSIALPDVACYSTDIVLLGSIGGMIILVRIHIENSIIRARGYIPRRQTCHSAGKNPLRL